MRPTSVCASRQHKRVSGVQSPLMSNRGTGPNRNLGRPPLLPATAVLEHERKVEEEPKSDDEADGRVDDLPDVHVFHAESVCGFV